MPTACKITPNGLVPDYVLNNRLHLFTDWGIETLMIIKKAFRKEGTTDAGNWGIDTDLIYWTKAV